MGQLVMSVAGAVVGGFVGFWVGGPAGVAEGAEIGWMAGGVAGGLIFRQKGPNPADIRVQDSAYGKPIPLCYGMDRLAGNVIWAGQPYVSNSGKGAKGAQQQQVSMSFAIGLCGGPVSGVRRIWANGQLIYDVSNPSNFEAISGSSSMVTDFIVYPGDENQNPDPTMQAFLGVANTPAYRGLAYVVFNNLNLSQWGNYLPSFSFEVVTSPAEGYYSSSVASFTYDPSDASLNMMPCITQNGGVAMGYRYATSYDGVFVANLNAYGAQQTTVLQGSWNHGGVAMPSGYSDVPGVYTHPGWLHETGVFEAWPNVGTMDLGFQDDECCFWRNGNDMFLSSAYNTAGRPIYRIDIGQEGLIAAQSTALGQYQILGGTTDYVYAIDQISATVRQFNRSTLALTATYTLPSGGPSIAAYSTGFVLDDDQIYIAQVYGVYLFRPSQNTLTLLGVPPFSPTTMNVINEALIVFSQCSYPNPVQFGYMVLTQGQTTTTLADIVADICNRAGMSSGEYDVSQLTDQVAGYSVTNHSAARSNLAPLMAAYFFDACDSDSVLRFVRRGSAPVGTFAYTDLGASPNIADSSNTNPIVETIVQEVDLPRSLTLTYPELDSYYNPNAQRAFRALTNSNKDMAMQAPIVFGANEAQSRTESMLWAAWVGRKSFVFNTGLSYLQYEPGDVMTLQGAGGLSYTVRITKCDYDGQGTLIWGATLEQPNIYPNAPVAGVGSSYGNGGVALGFAAQQIAYSGPTVLAVLDVPPLQNSDTSQGLYLAACGYAANWPGVAVDISRDAITYAQLVNIAKPAVIGYAASVLPTFGGGNQPDELSTVSVVVYQGELSSVTYADFLAGLSACYLGGELIFFRNATLTAANTYTLSGLLRARVGTEYAMTTHAAGERFVFLDATRIASIPIMLSDIGATLDFETFLLNIMGSNPDAPRPVTPTNARVKPLKPHLFSVGHGSAASLSDISLSWIRRARVNYAWVSGADVPLDESAENYTLTIYNGATLVRTVTVAGNGAGGSYVYTAAQIAADGFTSGNSITCNVSQNSDQGVAGYAATATISR